MKLLKVYGALKNLKQPMLYTRDVAAYLETDIKHANKILTRLQETGQLFKLRAGRWVFSELTDTSLLPIYLASPFPAYLSLQTALYHHAMISQVPQITYAVSIARTKIFNTPLGTVSLHHIQPDFFFGFETWNGSFLATPEKALIDLLYLSPTKTRLFNKLPEIEFPKTFNFKMAKKIIDKISSPKRRRFVKNAFDALKGSTRP